MIWTVLPDDVPCTAVARCRVTAGSPVYVMFENQPSLKRFRCVEHAPVPIDRKQLGAARVALEERLAIEEEGRKPTGSKPLPFASLDESVQKAQRKATGD